MIMKKRTSNLIASQGHNEDSPSQSSMQKMTTNVGVVSQAYISPCSKQQRLSLMILGVGKFTTHYCFMDGECRGELF